jgi:two-component system cell cycle sensor histidine kinase/response regulator CckA
MSGAIITVPKLPFPVICRVNAWIVFIGGVAGLFGWAAQLTQFYQFGPNIPAMMPWTAVSVTAVGVALIGRNLSSPVANTIVARMSALVVLAITAAMLFEYATGWNLGIDNLLLTGDLKKTPTDYPGRCSPQSATAFLALGLALLGGSRAEKSRRFNSMIEGLTLFSGIVALMAVFGYAYSVDALFRFPHLKAIGMSPYTAVYLCLACVGALIAEPSSWTVKILSRTSSGGEVARLLLPLFLMVPLGLGLLRIEAERSGWVTHEIGTSLMALAQVLIGVGMLFWLVYTIDRAAMLEKFVTMSCVSKRVLHDGEWIALEKFLYDQYHIQISHGMTPQEAQVWLDEAKEHLAQQKSGDRRVLTASNGRGIVDIGNPQNKADDE